MWLECQGFYPHDEEHIGTISYYPDQSFLADFFPYSHEHDYLSPLVAIKFDNVKRKYRQAAFD